MIASYLIDNFDSKIRKYFPSDDWKAKYKDKLTQIEHDEPWLTLIACYSVFGNQEIYSKECLSAINKILSLSGLNNKIEFSSIEKVRVEEKLPEILDYRAFLKESYLSDNFHLYPDRREIIKNKILKEEASFEGNTNLDLLVEGISNGRKTTCFIEAKFLSDISYQIKYNPVRDQIIRNIDSGIDYIQNKKYANNFSDFYFLLLTPMIFKTKRFGGNKSSLLQQLGADSSRLYCYKMQEYCDYKVIKQYLPHRQLKDNEWQMISNNIGWISFEDFYNCSKEFSTIENENEAGMIKIFFEDRNLI